MSVQMPFSDEVLKETTGKDWLEWKSALESWGAAEKSHLEIAKYLTEELEINAWWAQGITLGYERMIVRRAVGQRSDGSYSANVSKTLNASIERVHTALVDELARSQWLDRSVARLRTCSAPKSARFDDHEAKVTIAFFLSPKDNDKCTLQLQAEKLASKEAGDEWKAAWRPRLEQLAAYVEHSVGRIVPPAINPIAPVT